MRERRAEPINAFLSSEAAFFSSLVTMFCAGKEPLISPVLFPARNILLAGCAKQNPVPRAGRFFGFFPPLASGFAGWSVGPRGVFAVPPLLVARSSQGTFCFPEEICKSLLTVYLAVCIHPDVEEVFFSEAFKAWAAAAVFWVMSRMIWMAIRVFKASTGFSSSGASDE